MKKLLTSFLSLLMVFTCCFTPTEVAAMEGENLDSGDLHFTFENDIETGDILLNITGEESKLFVDGLVMGAVVKENESEPTQNEIYYIETTLEKNGVVYEGQIENLTTPYGSEIAIEKVDDHSIRILKNTFFNNRLDPFIDGVYTFTLVRKHNSQNNISYDRISNAVEINYGISTNLDTHCPQSVSIGNVGTPILDESPEDSLREITVVDQNGNPLENANVYWATKFNFSGVDYYFNASNSYFGSYNTYYLIFEYTYTIGKDDPDTIVSLSDGTVLQDAYSVQDDVKYGSLMEFHRTIRKVSKGYEAATIPGDLSHNSNFEDYFNCGIDSDKNLYFSTYGNYYVFSKLLNDWSGCELEYNGKVMDIDDFISGTYNSTNYDYNVSLPYEKIEELFDYKSGNYVCTLKMYFNNGEFYKKRINVQVVGGTTAVSANWDNQGNLVIAGEDAELLYDQLYEVYVNYYYDEGIANINLTVENENKYNSYSVYNLFPDLIFDGDNIIIPNSFFSPGDLVYFNTNCELKKEYSKNLFAYGEVRETNNGTLVLSTGNKETAEKIKNSGIVISNGRMSYYVDSSYVTISENDVIVSSDYFTDNGFVEGQYEFYPSCYYRVKMIFNLNYSDNKEMGISAEYIQNKGVYFYGDEEIISQICDDLNIKIYDQLGNLQYTLSGNIDPNDLYISNSTINSCIDSGGFKIVVSLKGYTPYVFEHDFANTLKQLPDGFSVKYENGNFYIYGDGYYINALVRANSESKIVITVNNVTSQMFNTKNNEFGVVEAEIERLNYSTAVIYNRTIFEYFEDIGELYLTVMADGYVDSETFGPYQFGAKQFKFNGEYKTEVIDKNWIKISSLDNIFPDWYKGIAGYTDFSGEDVPYSSRGGRVVINGGFDIFNIKRFDKILPYIEKYQKIIYSEEENAVYIHQDYFDLYDEENLKIKIYSPYFWPVEITVKQPDDLKPIDFNIYSRLIDSKLYIYSDNQEWLKSLAASTTYDSSKEYENQYDRIPLSFGGEIEVEANGFSSVIKNDPLLDADTNNIEFVETEDGKCYAVVKSGFHYLLETGEGTLNFYVPGYEKTSVNVKGNVTSKIPTEELKDHETGNPSHNFVVIDRLEHGYIEGHLQKWCFECGVVSYDILPALEIEGVIDSGKCGDDLIYILEEDGTLTISGTGYMDEYNPDSYLTPYYDQVTSVVIENGVTSIGSYAFYKYPSLSSVKIPYSVTMIGRYAFSECNKLRSVFIPSSVMRIGDYAFDLGQNAKIYVEASTWPTHWDTAWYGYGFYVPQVIWGYSEKADLDDILSVGIKEDGSLYISLPEGNEFINDLLGCSYVTVSQNGIEETYADNEFLKNHNSLIIKKSYLIGSYFRNGKATISLNVAGNDLSLNAYLSGLEYKKHENITVKYDKDGIKVDNNGISLFDNQIEAKDLGIFGFCLDGVTCGSYSSQDGLYIIKPNEPINEGEHTVTIKTYGHEDYIAKVNVSHNIVTFTGNSMDMSNEFVINNHLEINENSDIIPADVPDRISIFAYYADDFSEIPVKYNIESNTASIRLSAKDVVREIVLTAYVNGAKTDMYTISGINYLNRLMNNQEIDNETKSFVKNTIDFVNASHDFFAGNTVKNPGELNFLTSDYAYAVKYVSNARVSLKSASLILRDNLVTRVYFKTTESFNAELCTVIVNGYECETIETADGFCIEIDNLYSAIEAMSKIVVIYDNSLIIDLNFAPLSYVDMVLNSSSSDDLKNLVKSLAKLRRF